MLSPEKKITIYSIDGKPVILVNRLPYPTWFHYIRVMVFCDVLKGRAGKGSSPHQSIQKMVSSKRHLVCTSRLSPFWYRYIKKLKRYYHFGFLLFYSIMIINDMPPSLQ